MKKECLWPTHEAMGEKRGFMSSVNDCERFKRKKNKSLAFNAAKPSNDITKTQTFLTNIPFLYFFIARKTRKKI